MPQRTLALAGLTLALVIAGCGGDSESDTASTATASGDLVVALEIGPDAEVDKAIPAVVRVTNDTGTPVVIVRPEISPNFVYFEVRDSAGAPLPFDGPWLSLRPLEADDFIELAHGESVAHEFDLARWFQLTEGSYTVTAEYLNDIGGGGSEIDALVVKGVVSPPVDLEVG